MSSKPQSRNHSLFWVGQPHPSLLQHPPTWLLPASACCSLSLSLSNTHPSTLTPTLKTPPRGLAPEHIDSAVYLITAHNLFISPPWRRAAAVTQHTTRGLEEGYWGRKLLRGRGLKLEGETDGSMTAAKTITPHRVFGAKHVLLNYTEIYTFWWVIKKKNWFCFCNLGLYFMLSVLSGCHWAEILKPKQSVLFWQLEAKGQTHSELLSHVYNGETVEN